MVIDKGLKKRLENIRWVMSENTVDLSKEVVIESLAKGLGITVPDTYSKEFGASVIEAMNNKLNEHIANVPLVVSEDYAEEYVRNSFVDELTANMELEANDENRATVDLMVREAGDAINGLNKNVDAGVIVPLKVPVNTPNVETRTETQMVTKSVPERELSDATKADIKEVQTLLSDAIGRTNQLRETDSDVKKAFGLDEPLQNIGAVSDTWSENSLNAVNSMFDTLKVARGLSEKFPESGYTPELGKALLGEIQSLEKELEEINPILSPVKWRTLDKTLETLNTILPESQREKLFSALDRLSKDNELRPVELVERQVEVKVDTPIVETPPKIINPNDAAQKLAPVTEPDAETPKDITQDEQPKEVVVAKDKIIKNAIADVEVTLAIVGGHLDKMPGMGMISQFGLMDKLVTPLTEDDLKDDKFGENSQDMASKLIMGLKMVDGQKNATGEYNNEIGQNLRVSILTKPEFQFVRDQLKAEDGTPLRFFGKGGGALTGATAEEQQKLARKLLTFDETKPKAPEEGASQEIKDQYAAQMKARDQFEKAHENDLQSVRQLNAFFAGMDVLEQNNLYKNEQAKQTNKNNLMLDAASVMLDQWSPGTKTWLKDFFTNSQFGQMISGVLSQFFGINIGRLWGDKDDGAALDRSKPLIESSFTSFYNDAKEDLGAGADHKAIIAKTKDNIMETMDDSWKFKAAMKILFKGQDENVVKNAVEKALDAAQNSTDLKSAQNAFSNSLLESGNKYRNGQDLDDDDINRINAYLKSTSHDIQEISNSPVPSEDSNSSLNKSTPVGVTSLENSSSDLAAVMAVGSDGSVRARDEDAPAVDAEVINAGEKNIELVYTPNNDEWIQGQTRYAHSRVDDIQAVLGDNAEALGLSLNADGMKNDEGKYSDMLTPYTNAVIEETLIRAQIHELQEQGVVITQAHLDGFDRKLDTENLHTLTTYLQDKGVSAVDVAKLSEAIIGADGKGLGTDYYSTDPNDRSAGAKQDHSVLEQSHFGNQFELKLAQWVPAVAVKDDLTNDDPLRDKYLDYNKDRPCEIPMFYKKEGSDSVFALIRDKNGNDDPADDKFRELEYDDYLLLRGIQDEQAPELKAILDNYNWENPTDIGVGNVIDKVLGIDPKIINVNMPNAQVKEDVQKPVASREEHDRPEVFRDLRALNEKQADFMAEQLGLNKNPDLMLEAKREDIHPLEVFFEQQIVESGSQQNKAILLELDNHNIKSDDIDVIVAIKGRNGGLEFRYLNYEEDAIKPFSEQRAGNTDITGKDALFNVEDHANGQRRLDDFMDEIDRHYGAYTDEGIQNGYHGMSAIISEPGGSVRTVNGFHGVYGLDNIEDNFGEGKLGYHKASVDYMEANSIRFSERSGYDLGQEQNKYGNNNSAFGISTKAKLSLDEVTRHRLEKNSAEFNDKSGASADKNNASSSIDQNMSDMGTEVADAAIQQQQAGVSHNHSMGS